MCKFDIEICRKFLYELNTCTCYICGDKEKSRFNNRVKKERLSLVLFLGKGLFFGFRLESKASYVRCTSKLIFFSGERCSSNVPLNFDFKMYFILTNFKHSMLWHVFILITYI